MVVVEVGGGRGVAVYGPCRVRVVEGCFLVSGFEVCGGEELVVGSARGVTFFPSGGGGGRLVLEGGGGYSVVGGEGFRVAGEWLRVIDDIGGRGFRRVLVVGPVDSGKSSFACWVHNRLGYRVVEGDVGQNELGLPCFVSLSGGGRGASLLDVGVEAAWFVGHVSAQRVMHGVISSCVSAVRRGLAAGGGVVVDTDGFVSGQGVLYKLWLAEAVGADVVVLMGCGRLGGVFRGAGFEVVEAPSPPQAIDRGRFDRRVYRERMYARLFADTYSLVLDGVVVANVCRVSDVVRERGRTCFECDGRRVCIGRGGLDRRWARGLIAGLRVGGGMVYVPGLVESYDVCSGRLVVRVPRRFSVSRGDVGMVVLGCVRLGEGFREVWKGQSCYYPFDLLRGR